MHMLCLNKTFAFVICNLAILSLTYLNAAPVFKSTSKDDGDKDFSEALIYLERYGYFKPHFGDHTSNRVLSYVDLVSSIKDLQVLMRVNETGRLDVATMSAIRRPRCGVTDAVEQQHQNSAADVTSNRVRRYTVKWNKWNKKLITYRILNYPSNSDLTKDQVHEAIERAFDQFSNVTRLEFQQVTGSGYADIYMQFKSWTHGDGYPFDGANGTVAHAFLPDGRFGDYDGDVHFDDSEEFTHEGEKGYNLYQVALHELGHSLGLDHSWVAGAVMIPDYAGYKPDYSLAEDDVRAVQLLYGSGIPPKKALNPDAPCNKAYDAAAMIDGQLFVFKDRRYWRTAEFGKLLSPKEGEPIRRRFHNFPRRVDAVYQRPQDGKVVLFKGLQYWVYDKETLEDSYPRPVTELGLPEKMDAAVILNQYNKTYFFKDNLVWRYDEDSKSVDLGYPFEIIDVWEGIPSPVHAAFDFTDGNTYFVQRKKYYKYSSNHRNADPGYPRFLGQDFIGC